MTDIKLNKQRWDAGHTIHLLNVYLRLVCLGDLIAQST